jgi:hypothetical protein
MATIPAGTKFIGIDASVPTPELNGKRINDKTEHYTVEDIAAFAGVGSQGPQGVEGPAGPPGPVGPAGLEWQGSWDTDSSYNVDDAVGFNGSSWFCISAVTGTGNSNPEVATTKWALLAAQGATGPQGAQGPTGPQGPSGVVSYTEEARNTSSFSIAQNPSSISSKITKTFTRAFVSSPTNNWLGLSDLGKVVGDQFVIRNQSGVTPINVTLIDNARLLGTNGFETTQTFEIKPNTYARFTLVNTTGGSDRVFMVEVINPLDLPDLSVVNNPTTSALSLSTLNTTYPSSNFAIGTKVFCISITGGGLVYIKTGNTSWVSQSITVVS